MDGKFGRENPTKVGLPQYLLELQRDWARAATCDKVLDVALGCSCRAF
ncbi:uncharacterized protein SOCE26_090570 [Sorangium cellulosum]|uniref:Uncharacterized protein n=1 Tax=Sorangium cellulosum TaxID=56 RepID=A0A2L0F7H4_SORCE|nr:hypothetical protein [Sorangium cellulosum]AUX47536.1 uncharacterized protein SOCE26_090570 [Sorangium cellulosum]